MKKKTIKKHINMLYKSADIYCTICNVDNPIKAESEDFEIIRLKRSKKSFSQKQIRYLLSDKKAVYAFEKIVNCVMFEHEQIVYLLNNVEHLKNAKKINMKVLDDICWLIPSHID